jgi:hypothetical protein
MAKYLIQFSPSSIAGIDRLTKIASKESMTQMVGYLHTLTDRLIGEDLEDLEDLKLKGCKKIYFGEDLQYRIVYEVLDGGKIDILDVLAIGLREGFDVYVDAHTERQRKHR